MPSYYNKRIGLLLVLAFIVCTGFECGKPTEPKPIVDKDHAVYFWIQEATDSLSIIFSYVPEKNELDTIYIPYNFYSFEKGRKENIFYLLDIGIPNKYKVYNIQSNTFSSDLPYIGRLYSSPDSQLIAITYGIELNIINANDFSVVYSDSTIFSSAKFTKDNKKLYCFKAETPNLVILDRENNYARTEKQIDALGISSLPSYNGTKIFILNHLDWNTSIFEVYDFALDSIIFQHLHAPGHGFLTMTPDGKYVFYTNPGTLIDGTPADAIINAYNVETNQLEFINTTWYTNDSLAGMIPQEIAVTEDGKWLTATGFGKGGGYIVAIDIATLQLTDYKIVNPSYPPFWNLTSTNTSGY